LALKTLLFNAVKGLTRMGLFSNNTFRNRLNRLDTTDISEEALSDIKNYHYETTLHTL